MKATEGNGLNKFVSFMCALALGVIALAASACEEKLDLQYYHIECPENASLRTYTGKNGKRGDTLAAKWCADVINGQLNGRVVIMGPYSSEALLGQYSRGEPSGTWRYYQQGGQGRRDLTFKDGHVASTNESVAGSKGMVVVRESEVVCDTTIDTKTQCRCIQRSVYPDKTNTQVLNAEVGNNCNKELPFQVSFAAVNASLGKPVNE